MTKKILQLIVVLLLITQGVMAQTVDIDDVTRAPGNIEVPVNMLNYTDIGAITLSIAYDADLMEFMGINNIDPLFTGSWNTGTNGSEISIVYVAPTNSGTTISGPAFNLQFSYSGGFTGNLLINDYSEIADINMGLIPSTFIDGSVTQSAAVGAVSMTDLTETIGDAVSMPVNMGGTGFGEVSSITLLIAYDDMQLTYTGLANSVLSGVEDNASNGVITINWAGSAMDFTTAMDIFDLEFTYNGGNAIVEFISGCEVVDVNLDVLAVDYTDGEVTATPGTASLTLSTVVGDSLDVVSVPVMAANFGDDVLGAITMEISYDNSLMDFTGITEQQLSGWVVSGNGSGEITLNWTNDEGGTLTDASMLLLNFVFFEIAGEAELMFEPGSIVKDINLDTYPVSFNSGIIITTVTVSGQLTYNGDASKEIYPATVYLKNSTTDAVMYTTTTDAAGDYEFDGVVNGSYYLDGETTIDATYAYDLIDAYYIYGVGGTLTGLQALAADVNEIGGVDIVDAYIVYGSYGGGTYVKVGAWTAPDWFFENTAVIVNDAAVSQDFGAIASGDANASFIPVP